ncbi:MAG: hypothetical protein K6A23_13425 [Butyrivibrio sp.]|nr:hypothetical protein [Butyrivibrio sp.]
MDIMNNKRRRLSAFGLCAIAGVFLIGCNSEEIEMIHNDIQNEQMDNSETEMSVISEDENMNNDDSATENTSDPDYESVNINKKQIMANMDILKTLYDENSGENVLFSPVSLNTALEIYGSMLDNESAKTQLEEYLGEKNYLSYNYNNTEVYRSINTIWADQNHDKLDFSSIDKELTIQKVDMSDPASTDKKNKYVSEQTDGFIESTPVEFDEDTIMDIMNILYFQDGWEGGPLDEFEEYTEFKNADGTTSELEYMIGNDGDSSCYYKGNSSTAFYLDYINGMSFWAVLPNEESFDFESLTSDVDGYINNRESLKVNKSENGLSLEVVFAMPCFENSFNTGFEDTAIPSLIQEPISTDICPYEIKNSINQIAKIKVDETGTTAAAVTEVVMELTAMPSEMPEQYYFICDRPFMYFIYDNVNEDIAFMGIVNKIK